MGKADVYESDYLEKEEIFADLVNGVLYQGRQVVKPQELREQDTELRSISGNHVKKTIRDKVRLWKGTIFAVFAVENQTKVDYHMVLRTMLSESMAYDRQWKKLRNQRISEKEKLAPDEFISGMRKRDKLIPVITIVIYYGTDKPWDGARTLYELLDTEGMEDHIIPYISNHQLNIFDFHDYDDFGQFHSELRFVFEFLRYSEDRKKLAERMTKNREWYEKLSNQAKLLLAHLTNIKKILNVEDKDFRKGEFSMCKAFEDMEKKGRMDGRAEEIIETGREFHFAESKILERLQNKLNISMEKAREYLIEFEDQSVSTQISLTE